MMNLRLFKTKAITKMLTLLGFSSVAFVFTACYGTMPAGYQDDYQDSLSVAFSRAEADSIAATDSTEATQPLEDVSGDTATSAR